MEVLQQDNLTFLVYYRCKIIPPGKPAAFGGTSQTSSVDSYSSLALDGRVYELKLPDDYDVKPYNVYYLKDGGDWKEFITMRQLKSYYKKNKKQLDAYLKANPVDFNEATEVMKLIQYMENTEH
jgi:enterochelin esterase-like enzyme